MRALVQRVSEASVIIDNKLNGSIQNGLLVFLGIELADTELDIPYLIKKITQLRIFDDEQGVMNKSVLDINGSILLISQFTLHAITKKGNRPSYIQAARPEQAIPLYEMVIKSLNETMPHPIETGIFGADMKVQLINDGPITILIDSKD